MVVSYTVGCRISVESRKKYFRVIFAIFGHFWAQKSRNFSKNNFFLKFYFYHFYRFLAKKKVKKIFWDQVCLTLSHFLPKKKNDIVFSWLYDDCQLGFYLELTCFNLAYIFPNTVLILYISSFSGKK